MCLDKTIKLWKIGSRHKYPAAAAAAEKKLSCIRDGELSMRGASDLAAAAAAASPGNLFASPQRVYPNAHAYHINSISLNSDGSSFLSADDLRINWWSKDIVESTCSTNT